MINTSYLDEFNSPLRTVVGKVELLSSTTAETLVEYTSADNLKSINIDRAGEQGKFFGFGVFQKATIELLDKERAIELNKDNVLKVQYKIGENDFITTAPSFYIDDVKRDENTNGLAVTAYDLLHKATAHTVAELELEAPYTIADVLAACAVYLGASAVIINDVSNVSFNPFNEPIYQEGANFEGTETLKEVLDSAAEATQSIYFVNKDNALVFKQLSNDAAVDLTIGKVSYFTLNSKEDKQLATIVHTTELGDNVTATSGEAGETQYVRNNPFWEMQSSLDIVTENALSAVNGLSLNQFNCKWRGNFLLEIGDKIELITKDDLSIISYVLNDKLTYNGGMSQTTSWEYSASDAETASNPSTLGEVLKQTFAKVDKANKEIQLVASEISENRKAIASLTIDTQNINASVENLTSKVETAITAEDLTIAVRNEIAEGTTKVVTSTGFVFDENGLAISKTNSDIDTNITDDGMIVRRSGNEVLTANNQGVKAEDLHATTFLIIGNNSRLEDYEKNGNKRTGCFWIGG